MSNGIKYIPSPQKMPDNIQTRGSASFGLQKLFNTKETKNKRCLKGIKCRFIFWDRRCNFFHPDEEIKYFKLVHDNTPTRTILIPCNLGNNCKNQLDFFMKKSSTECWLYHTDKDNDAMQTKAIQILKQIEAQKNELKRIEHNEKMYEYECKYYVRMRRLFLVQLEKQSYIFRNIDLIYLVASFCFDLSPTIQLHMSHVIKQMDWFLHELTSPESKIRHFCWDKDSQSRNDYRCAGCYLTLTGTCLCTFAIPLVRSDSNQNSSIVLSITPYTAPFHVELPKLNPNNGVGFHLWCANHIAGIQLSIDPLRRFEHNLTDLKYPQLKLKDIRDMGEKWYRVEFMNGAQYRTFEMETFYEFDNKRRQRCKDLANPNL